MSSALEEGLFRQLTNSLEEAGCGIPASDAPEDILKLAIWFVDYAAKKLKEPQKPKALRDSVLVAAALTIQAGTTVEHLVRQARKIEELLKETA